MNEAQAIDDGRGADGSASNLENAAVTACENS
jgi:hypothetical protein